jgi:Ca2+-binding RTX toxin-like protein
MAEGQTFYVDPINGNDGNDGLSAGAAWESVPKVNAHAFEAGDTVLFKSGEVYHAPLRITAMGTESGPVKFGSYGQGPNPVFDGSLELHDAVWTETSAGSGVWMTPVRAVGGEDPGRLFLNGASANLEASSISDVTAPGDWTWSDGTLAVYSDNNPSGAFSSVQIQVQNRMIDVRNSSHVVIDGIDVSHARYGIVLTNTDHAKVMDSNTSSNTVHGMTIVNGSGNVIHGGSSYDNGVNGGTSATRIGHGVLLDGTSNNVVEGMALHDNAEDGVQFGPHDGDGNTIRNNEMFDNGEDGADIKSGDQTFVGNFIHDNVENGLNLNGSAIMTVVRNYVLENGKSALDGGAFGSVISSDNIYVGGNSTTVTVWAPNRSSSFIGDTFVDGGLTSRTSVGLSDGRGHVLADNTFIMTNPGAALRIDRSADNVTLEGNSFYTDGAYTLQFTGGKTIHSDNNLFVREDTQEDWIRVDGARAVTYDLPELLNGTFSQAQGMDRHSTFSSEPVDVHALAESYRNAEPPAVGTGAAGRVFGTPADDQIVGTSGDDDLSGEAGNDWISGGNGDDLLNGGTGNDTIIGGAGIDRIDGGDGRDTLQGNTGDDVIYGGTDDDWLFGGDGDDLLFGEAGDDGFSGGAGNDVLVGGDGMDTLQGDAGNDALSGGNGDDRLFGGDHDDVLFGEAGNDSLSGGSGNDLLSGGDGFDVLQGDAGRDTLEGGAGNDRLAGGAGDDTLRGGAGDDRLEGGADRDWIAGGTGADYLLGGTGADLFVFDQIPDAVDTIGDFEHAVDMIALASAVFAGMSGFTSRGEFIHGDGQALVPVNDEPTLLYNERTGALSFDPDGIGNAQAFQFVQVANHAALTESDFDFI